MFEVNFYYLWVYLLYYFGANAITTLEVQVVGVRLFAAVFQWLGDVVEHKARASKVVSLRGGGFRFEGYCILLVNVSWILPTGLEVESLGSQTLEVIEEILYRPSLLKRVWSSLGMWTRLWSTHHDFLQIYFELLLIRDLVFIKFKIYKSWIWICFFFVKFKVWSFAQTCLHFQYPLPIRVHLGCWIRALNCWFLMFGSREEVALAFLELRIKCWGHHVLF